VNACAEPVEVSVKSVLSVFYSFFMSISVLFFTPDGSFHVIGVA